MIRGSGRGTVGRGSTGEEGTGAVEVVTLRKASRDGQKEGQGTVEAVTYRRKVRMHRRMDGAKGGRERVEERRGTMTEERIRVKEIKTTRMREEKIEDRREREERMEREWKVQR